MVVNVFLYLKENEVMVMRIEKSKAGEKKQTYHSL